MKASYFFTVIVTTTLIQTVTPYWWTLLITTALAALWMAGPVWRIVGQAGAATALVWLGYALWAYFGSDGLLTKRLAESFHLPHPSLLFLLTTVVAGLMGGLGALCGYRLRQHLMPRAILQKTEAVYSNQD